MSKSFSDLVSEISVLLDVPEEYVLIHCDEFACLRSFDFD